MGRLYRFTMNRTSLRIRLSTAIVKTHGAAAQWVKSTPVSIKTGGSSWRCDVDTFELIKHPQAKYCYAWAHDVGDNSEIIMALKAAPVNSPEDAVREYLDGRKAASKK